MTNTYSPLSSEDISPMSKLIVGTIAYTASAGAIGGGINPLRDSIYWTLKPYRDLANGIARLRRN
jgi:hypothetical protein